MTAGALIDQQLIASGAVDRATIPTDRVAAELDLLADARIQAQMSPIQMDRPAIQRRLVAAEHQRRAQDELCGRRAVDIDGAAVALTCAGPSRRRVVEKFDQPPIGRAVVDAAATGRVVIDRATETSSIDRPIADKAGGQSGRAEQRPAGTNPPSTPRDITG